MKTLIEILKGAVIGIANIVPGLSGGTIAVVMNIYDKLITAVTEIFKHPIKAIKSVWMYGVGVAIGIVIGIFGISFLLKNYEIPTTSLFIGLIIGALPIIINQIDKKKIKIQNILVCIIMIAVVVGLPFLNIIGAQGTSTNPFIYLGLGLIAAATMVIPGVSGSMILMTLGYYDKVMILVKDTLQSFMAFDINALIPNMILVIPFGIGVIIGIVLVAELIKWLLKNCKQGTNFAILGLVIASPFAVIMKLDLSSISIGSIIISIVTFVIGMIIANLFNKIKE